VEVWQTSNLRRLRLGEERKKERKKEETTGQKYNVRICYVGGHNKVTAKLKLNVLNCKSKDPDIYSPVCCDTIYTVSKKDTTQPPTIISTIVVRFQ